MIVRHQPATTRRPVPTPRPTLRRRAVCQFIAMALFGGGVAHAATPPAFSPAWFAQKQQQAATAPSQPAGGNGNTVSYTPGSALLQQRVQQSITNLNNAAASLAAQMQQQKDAQAAAAQLVSNAPNGLAQGGLQPAAGISTDPSLWQNANAPTDTVAGTKHTVEVKQTAKKAILTWDSFNVGKDTTLYFNQSAGNQAGGANDWIALNRVNDPSSKPSQILGQMKAEGTVYLLNRNGVVFGAGSQVNTHSLIASSLSLFSEDVQASNTVFLSQGLNRPGADILTASFTDDARHAVVVEKGASISSGTEGFVLLAAPDVTNAGSIIADDGQAILAATTRLGNASLNAPLSVYDPDRSSSDVRNTLVNTGLVQARRGTIELHGTDVSQSGVLVASTSIAHPGQISIVAGRGQSGRDDTQFLIAGKASFTPGSVTAILPEKDGTTTSSSAAADAAFTTGSVNVLGGKVVLSGGALIEAPGGNVTLTAVRPGLAATSEDGRVYIDSGATIDVSGLANVELPMSALLVTIPRVGQNELANSPLLRNSALYTQKNLVVDSSVSGTRADGLDWIGSPILNVAGYVENVPRDISQLLTQGGSITLDGAQVIARDGSRLALDGGYLAYQAGWVTTPNLLGVDGLIHNISSADPDVAYVGFAGQFTSDHARWGVSQTYHSPIMAGTRRWSEGFVQGADAGALTVKASDAVALDGDISAQATTGVRQAANGSQPDGGRFIFSDVPSALTGVARRKGLSVQSTSLVLGNGFDEDTTWDDVEDAVAGVAGPVGNPRDWLVLSSALLGQAGFANVSLSSLSAVVVGSDSTLAVQPGGSVTIAGARIDVDGKISAPAGSISLSTSKPVVAPGQATDADGYSPADITVADGAVLSTRGLWVNDAGRSGDTLQGDRYINGGSISLATTQAYLGDEANRQDGTGSIVLQSGSLLDVSGGGYVDTKGHVALDHGVPVGHGGDVSIKTYATPGSNDAIDFGSAIPPLALTEGRVLLGGTIAGDGFAGGGTLALQAAEIRIGGSPDDLVNANGLWLDPGFFAGKGFDNYQLNAITDGTVAAATHVTVQRDNIIADIDALRSLASNGDIYTAGQSHVGTLDAYQRWATRDTSAGHGPGFALTSGDFLSWKLNLQDPEQGAPSYDGVTGTVSVGPGASVAVDAGGTVLLQGTQATLVDGMVEAHGGAITVGTRNLNSGTPRPTITPYVSLGADATLDASGIALINALATPVTSDTGAVGERIVPRTGTVLDGGQVNLTSNAGYVVAGTGALLDVSGAADTFDLPVAGTGLRASTTTYTPSLVWSNGGSINMSAAAGLFSDATVDAHAGSANGDGGSLAVWGEGITSPLQPFPLATRIVVEAGATTPDLTVPNGVLHVGTDRLANAGLADITLGSVSDDVTQSQSTPVVFAGDVELAATRSVTLQVLSIDSDGGRAHIKAPYVRLLGLGAAPAPAGDGRLVVDANTIDMGGDLTLRGWANAAFNATGDIRFVAPSAQAYDATGKPVTGVLSTTGNLDFQAGQLYPVTNYTFAVVANALGAVDADGKPIETSITVHPGGASQTPLSAGGSLLLDADHIEQGGTIRVPSGELVLGVSDTAGQAAEFNIDASLHPLVATQSVHLASGSVTSVSLDGLIVPYGTTIDGTEWRYNGRAGVATPDLVAPPAKEIGLHGQNLALDAGATVDVSGGGSLQAGEWVPGVGGSRDVLAQYAAKDGSATSGKAQYADGRAVYAILPGKQSSVAAYDAAFAAQGGDAPAVGQQVYLSGMPGLPAGYYTLLPARYAEVPGAYRVVQDTSAVDSTLGRASRQADGGYAVSGYFGNALSGSRDARNTTFIVQSRDTWGQYSQYTYTDADTFFNAQASKAGKVAPRVAADAGRLTLDAGASLALGLALTGEPAKGGRNSQVDIAAEAIQVLGGDTTVKDGYLGVSADQLTTLGAGSLLLGGTRTTTGEGDRVSIQANSVLLGNDAAHPLSGQEIMLVARGDQAGENGIVLAPGSALLASGATNPVGSQPLVFGADAGVDANGQATAAVSGDGALLRISQNGTAAVIRHDVTGFDGPAGTPTGALSIGAGANVRGGSALTLDATGRMSVSEDAQLGGTAIDASANRIAFVGAGVDGGDDGLVLGPRTLDLFRGANEVTLRSRGEMDFLGDVAVSLAHALTLDAGAFVGDGSDVTVQAATLGFGNALGASQGEAATPGGGVFRVAADEVDFGAGSSSLRGFSAFSGTATSGFAGQGAGGMDFGGATVELTAPQFLADSGASTKLLTTGAMRLENAAGTGLTRDTLGGALTLQGGSIDAGMAMKASAGGLVLRATDGDVHVDAGSTLDVAGVNRTFFDTQAYAPGGNLSISSATGAVTIDSGATLLFGGGKAGGDAGSLTLSAAGPVALNGAIDGRAASGYRGAYFTYATGSSVDLDALNQRASAAGATGMLNISSGSGDLALSSGQTLTAGKVYLSANGGTTRIDGTVDASGPVGGHVELYGKNGVDIEGRVLARSSIAAQRGGDVIIGTTGQGSQDKLDPTYGYELVQRADAGVIHVGANALIDVSGGSTAPIAGGRISFRAPLLADGDVPVQVDNARSLVGARDVTIEPYAVWSTADHGTNAAQHFDGIIDPAGWYTRDTDGKPVLVAGTWTDATGKVLAAPTDDAQLKDYLTRNYFTPTTANADHTGFYGYAGADAASGPGTLMGFIEQPGFAFGGRYSAIANIHVRPGVELSNPANGSGVDAGTIHILTNWNLGAGTTAPDGTIDLAYRYGADAPVFTFRAGGDVDIRASISDGFYQRNTGAVLADPVSPTDPGDPGDPGNPPPTGDNGYGDALLAYQESQAYMDQIAIWDNGTVNLKIGSEAAAGNPDGNINLTQDPNWQALQAPLTNQSANYYANYDRYIDEIGNGTNQKWAYALNDVNANSQGFLTYAPNGAGAPDPAAYPVYADYATAYETWLEGNFYNIRGSRETTPTPLMQPIDANYNAYSANYGVYIDGHFTYYNYVYNNVGSAFGFGTQLFYAPFAPRSDAASGGGGSNPAYDSALSAFQSSESYLDNAGIWNNGKVNLKVGSEAAAGNPDSNIDLTQDPNWQALQAPLTGQSANYYTNYGRYIDEVGDGTNQKWAYALNDVNANSQGFLTYAPNGAGAPDPAAYPVYADYATAYETWLEGNFYNIRGSRETTPTPLMQPLDADYTAYTTDYATYITGHNTYFNYVYNNVGSAFGFGAQIFYAPFAPRSDAASTGGNPAYDSALAAYQSSESYLDTAGIWNNGKVNLKVGSEAAAGNPDSNIDLTRDPNWQALQAPLTGQSANYYTNYGRYIDEVGDGTNQKWAYALNDVNANSQGFLTYAPNGAGAPDPAAYPVYADYATAYETWLEGNFYNIRGSRETTPTPLMQPLDADYAAYTTDYATYITGHNTYFNYVYNNVGSAFGFGTQIFYAPFAPRSDAASTGGNPAYDSALAAYQSSESYLDTAGIWNNGKVNLKVGSEAAAGNPDSNIDLTRDPNWQALQAPLTGQSANYYTNYGRYIDEVGDGTNQKWAYALNDVNANSQGFLTYAPNGAGAPDPAAYPVYADYATAYETWLEGNFYNIRGSRETTPTPLMQPLDADYTAYTTDYATYITGHNTYFNYVYNNVGSPFGFGTQIFYAPFAPRSDVASGGGGDNGGGGTTVPIPVAAANNSPSNMPSLGNPVSFASATLLSGPSSSFRIIAGADLASADPLAVQAGSSGNVTLDGHFAVKDTLTDPTVVDPKSPLAGKTLLFPTTIRTGTGSIDVVSAGDIRWQDAAAPAAIYTAGQPSEGTTADTGVTVNRPATSGTFTDADLPDMLVSGVVNPDGAGDIQLHAGGSIAALQNPVDTDGSVTKDKAGSSIAQYWWQWMQTGNAADGSRSSINFSNFAQGVMSVGGNVSVEAGGDIKQLAVSLPTTWYLNADGKAFTTVGGGNLDVHAGGDILSGAYFVSRGIGRIDAEGAIGVAPSLAAVATGNSGGGSGPATTPLSTLIALQDAQVTVTGREGVDLGGVYNPSYYRGSSFQFILPAGHADFQSYSSASSLAITSTLGDITFGSLLTPGAIFGNGGQAGPFLPATVSMAALDGGINVLTDGVLYPSAQGNLSMLATGDIAFSRQTANDSTGTVFGLSDKTEAVDSRLGATLPIAPTTDEGASSAFSHDEVPLHGADDEPVRIYSLNGDITDGTTAPNGFNYLSLTIIPSKQALIYAGRDIVNLSFLGQHVHDADITRIAAGRDIYDTSFSPNAGYNLYNPNGYALAGRLLLGGPGSFLVEAGRDIGPLTSQLEVAQDVNQAKSPTGIQSVGNLYNVYLPHEGADVNVAFGVGPGVTTEAFLSRYLDTPDTADAFGSFDADLVDFMQRRVEGTVVDTGYVQDKPSISLTVEQARALLAKEPEYVQRQFAEQMLFHMLADVGRDYNDPASPFSGQYKRGYAALDALFPASLGYTSNGAGDGGLNGSQSPITTGNLDIRSTTIQTQQGGDVTIVGPGGQALIGSTSAPAQVTDSNGTVLAGPNTMGVLTLEQGTINMFTDRSVLLAQSRIFTEQGGDVTIWSSNGDINAGQGAKTTAEIPPPVYICDNDAWCRLDARGQVSGAGIATLQTIQGAPGGTVSLIAPRGTVDAGDAGIRVQGGDLIIAAARVANADNIQVSGDTIGIPVTAAVNVGALNAASAAATAATQAAEDVVRKQQSDARDRVPSVISVDVLRDGNNGASILRPDAASPVKVLGSGRLDSASEAALTAEERRNLR